MQLEGDEGMLAPYAEERLKILDHKVAILRNRQGIPNVIALATNAYADDENAEEKLAEVIADAMSWIKPALDYYTQR